MLVDVVVPMLQGIVPDASDVVDNVVYHSLARQAVGPDSHHVRSMSDWTNTAIAAAAALLASGLTGAITLRAAGRSELSAALQAYGYAMDRLGVEISQMPPSPGRVGGATQRAVARARHVDWSLGQISRHTLARPAMRALDTYMAASNRLMLVAPARGT